MLGFFFFSKLYLTEATTRFASGKDLQRTRDLTKNWNTCLAHSGPGFYQQPGIAICTRSVILSTKELTQEDLKFSASLDYIDPVSKNQKKIFL